jgi:hypothetical protein
MKNADGEEHSRRADMSGQCYKAAVIKLTVWFSREEGPGSDDDGGEHAGYAGGV